MNYDVLNKIRNVLGLEILTKTKNLINLDEQKKQIFADKKQLHLLIENHSNIKSETLNYLLYLISNYK